MSAKAILKNWVLSKPLRVITKFNSHAISSSMDMTIADAPASTSSDLRDDNLDATSKPAYFMSWTRIGLFSGFDLDSFHISSTRFKSYKKTNSWFFLEMTAFNSSAASDEKRNCSLHRIKRRWSHENVGSNYFRLIENWTKKQQEICSTQKHNNQKKIATTLSTFKG